VAQATAAGAEFIVGPLTREEVVAAADLLTTRPPLLALNFLPPIGRPRALLPVRAFTRGRCARRRALHQRFAVAAAAW
jgi:hypothetical protein